MNAIATPVPTSGRRPLNIALWVGQLLLVLGFAYPSYLKFTITAEQLNQAMAGFPLALARFIATAELLGIVGVILPALTRIRPQLTAWAATGLLVIMVLASAFHASRGETQALPMTIGLGIIALFVAWGRFKGAPIAPRR